MSPSNFTTSFRDILDAISYKIVHIRPGQTIFTQGEKCDRVYFIEHGIVRLSTVSQEGKAAVVSIMGTGDVVGVECLAGGLAHETTAVALVRSTAIKVRSAALMQLLHHRLSAAGQFINYLTKLYLRVQRDFAHYLLNTSEKRLARALLLVDDYGRGIDSSILETITQDTLAEMVGTTRTRVNFFMNQFKKKGYVQYDDVRLNISPSLREMLG